jgi:uncharacterized protein (DUF433 family)
MSKKKRKPVNTERRPHVDKEARKDDSNASVGLSRIEINPKVMLGKPVIRGTRIPVEIILRKLSEGATEPELISAYPRLVHEDVLAALAYGAATTANEEVIPLESLSGIPVS